MTTKPKRWSDIVAAMPRLSAEQMQAVFDIVERHLSPLVSDHPPVDEAHYAIQQDVQSLTAKARP